MNPITVMPDSTLNCLGKTQSQTVLCLPRQSGHSRCNGSAAVQDTKNRMASWEA